MVAACAPYSAREFADYYQMMYYEVDGEEFRHLVFERYNAPPDDRLHVYIEGDGTPWVGNRSNTDPTPRIALALELASEDTADVVYIGRPCYFGVGDPDRCSPKYWTSHRYGEEVLHSMVAAIEKVRQPEHLEVVLIGHSGGGAIAALLEPRIDGVVAVVTIGANLDIEAWTSHHGYDPLHGSLNPASQDTRSDVPHYQLLGRSDDNVPMKTARHYGDDRENVRLKVYDGFDHVCCWEKEWSDFLSDLNFDLEAAAELELSGG